MEFPIKNGDFPLRTVSSPEGNHSLGDFPASRVSSPDFPARQASKTHALVHLESHENTGGEVGALAASDWNWNFRNLTMDNAHSYIYIYIYIYIFIYYYYYDYYSDYYYYS